MYGLFRDRTRSQRNSFCTRLGEGVEGVGDGIPEVIKGSDDGLFDRVDVRRIGRQVEQPRACALEGLFDAFDAGAGSLSIITTSSE